MKFNIYKTSDDECRKGKPVIGSVFVNNVRQNNKATLSIYMNEDGLPSISSASEGNRNALIDAWNERKGDD